MMRYTVEFRDPVTLAPHPLNWTLHPDAQRAVIAQSIARFGYVYPVLYNRRTERLIDGHDRVAQAVAAGEEAVPVHVVDLDEGDERELLLTLRKSEEGRGTDEANLYRLLTSHYQERETFPPGWNATDYESLASAFGGEPPEIRLPAGEEVLPHATNGRRGPAGDSAPHVRMVQLFYNGEEHAEITRLLDTLTRALKTHTQSDTVLEVLRYAAAHLSAPVPA